MGTRASLINERDAAQSKLDALARLGDDTFNLGTVLAFSSASNHKWYYLKVGEELWMNMQASGAGTKDLAGWVLDSLDSLESGIGYFEVYELRVQPTPFYASA